ncbi:succinate dehydrogenase, hydrophobic membrane anchor protein [Alteraurantiacibacter aestuarii]|uniref:Succinate dehydrogenase hydrophobic membrane anchor subunit n=1 Tax=Alteraurantiacibacter aestuarii TaxID=650004 RepID=A0A844ZKF8_9SPHN|nr:succinate dehydrogenase, hydrophobic membrane anchor protein [Alteraurantiacibacter aestuarii]MXO87626.1 succinate dehydrogenase, hydrophobic membrane anchor protein [Alteraurantiacibacter aestuarii]
MGEGTSIGRVRGLGSAKHGAHHWLLQRFTAAGNLLLGLYLAFAFVLLPDLSYATVTDWISGPVQATLVALFVISTFWHARLGLQVLIEDYLHEAGTKFAAVLALNLFAFAGAAFGLFAIVRLALGAAA